MNQPRAALRLNLPSLLSPKPGLHLGEGLLNWVEVGGVRREVAELCSYQNSDYSVTTKLIYYES